MSRRAFPITSAAIADLQRATERLRAANDRLCALLESSFPVPEPSFPLIAATEVAARCGCTAQTVKNWCRRYRLGFRLAGRWVLPAATADALARGVPPEMVRSELRADLRDEEQSQKEPKQ
jgi:hypothetical protein